MAHHLAVFLFALTFFGLALVAAQGVALRRHVAGATPPPTRRPPISILKPLCGVDDGLWENLALFAALEYPDYEVVLGVKSARDPAWDLARAAVRRWPRRFRVVVQRGEPGLNPKVNQLLTLAREARHDLLVVSDSNVRVAPGYLAEIAGLLEDEGVGLVTHPVVGEGAVRLGSLFDHLHLAGAVAPGVVAAKRLGKRVALAPSAVRNVSERQSVSAFTARYRRWAVLQRQLVGPGLYAAQALLNPVLLAAAALACERSALAAAGFAGTCVAKSAVDGAAARALRPAGFAPWQLALVPLKDLLFGGAWAYGLFHREVDWRGTKLLVGPGSRVLAPIAAAASRGAHGEATGAPTPSFTI